MKKLPDLKRRMFISLISSVVVALLIIFSYLNWMSIIVAVTIAFLAAVGVWEYAQLVRAKELKPFIKLMIVVAVCQVFAFFLHLRFFDFPLLPFVVAGGGLIVFFVAHFKDIRDALLNVAVEFFSVCYIAIPLSLFLGILYPSSNHLIAQDGRWWLFYLIIVTKVTDIGAYFVGRLWGKHKLAPHLSPKKTVEGALGGFICATAISIAMSYLGKAFSEGTFDLSLSEAVWLGMMLSVAGQIGDLSESLLKRDAFVKDSNTLPGLGGVLDMIDSLLITSPILFFFLRLH
jgi:phosphatidate cytidylyltransferase